LSNVKAPRSTKIESIKTDDSDEWK
jgi:hypothetical protein